MRGSGGSFGITTSIEVTTFPAPPSATVFQYTWDLSAADAVSGVAAFQSFVIPPEFGVDMNLFKGSASGRVAVQLTGGWYGPADGLNATIAPFLSQIPTSPKITLNVGTYINSVAVLGERLTGSQMLNTSELPETYGEIHYDAKSSPMSTSAITTFMNYLAYEGFSSTMVCTLYVSTHLARHLTIVSY
jgi:hypothetical protein